MNTLLRMALFRQHWSTLGRVPCLTASGSRCLHASTRVHDSAKGRMDEFFDNSDTFGKQELAFKERPGRSWSVGELRLKSSVDLHKLWYVLLKERNMLLTMEEVHKKEIRLWPNPERLDRVKESMENLEAVVRERNRALMELEYGETGETPTKTVTSFMGFKYEKQLQEHLEPPHMHPVGKEYETPYLDDDAYMMQKLWSEKEWWKRRNRADDLTRRSRKDRSKIVYHQSQLSSQS